MFNFIKIFISQALILLGLGFFSLSAMATSPEAYYGGQCAIKTSLDWVSCTPEYGPSADDMRNCGACQCKTIEGKLLSGLTIPIDRDFDRSRKCRKRMKKYLANPNQPYRAWEK